MPSAKVRFGKPFLSFDNGGLGTDGLFPVADWDNASLSNETLLDTVSRFVFAALLKHTGLLGQGCGEGRYCSSINSSLYMHTVVFEVVDVVASGFISMSRTRFKLGSCIFETLSKDAFFNITHQVPTIKISC